MRHHQLRTPEQRLADYEAAYQNALDSEQGLDADQCAEFEHRIAELRLEVVRTHPPR